MENRNVHETKQEGSKESGIDNVATDKTGIVRTGWIDIEQIDKKARELFSRYSKMDLGHMDEKFVLPVWKSRSVLAEKVRIPFVCCRLEKTGFNEEEREINFRDFIVKTNRAYFCQLREAKSVTIAVVTLAGFEEVLEQRKEDMLENYFYDVWGSACISAAVSYLIKKMSKEIRKCGGYPAHTLSPGQHGLSIENQKEIFRILTPETIGVSLLDSYLMTPEKSASFLLPEYLEPMEEFDDCSRCECRNRCSFQI